MEGGSKDKEILKELQGGIKDVDVKFQKLKDPQKMKTLRESIEYNYEM